MAKIDITKTELVWPGKYDEDGSRREVARVHLPFQVIETVNESRATREEKKKPENRDLFDYVSGKEGDTFEDGWKNKLIWGDNLLVMGSLLEQFSGKIDLIYIDPPFATGADFSVKSQVGESGVEISKEQTIIEEKAYRDTWGRGMDSYITMMYERLMLMRELLSDSGSIYVHCDWRVNSYIRLAMDEVFGKENFKCQIAWKKLNSPKSQSITYGNQWDSMFVYTKTAASIFNQQYYQHTQEYIASFNMDDNDGRGSYLTQPLKAYGVQASSSRKSFEFRGVTAQWLYSHEKLEAMWNKNTIYTTSTGDYRKKFYLADTKGNLVSDFWTDKEVMQLQGISNENINYPTQKPEALLDRIIKASSNEGNLVADFFCGSGTTTAVAEKLGRRWITCDLGRWAVHTTRKRMLGIENCKPFDVLNLGKYERQYWQGVTFGDDKNITEQTLYQYLAFILKLYGAQPLAGMAHLHGKKGKALVHIGAVDAPVTINQVNQAVEECIQNKQQSLHVLGWEWEMGLNDLVIGAAKSKGVKLSLFNIPREVMEQQATDRGDVRFFELAYLETEIKQSKKRTVQIKLKDFVMADAENLPEEARKKVKEWSDYIDYWAVDWDFQGDTFMQGWVAYRTRKERALPLVSDEYTYARARTYRALVKVIDIFGNDTSQMLTIKVK